MLHATSRAHSQAAHHVLGRASSTAAHRVAPTRQLSSSARRHSDDWPDDEDVPDRGVGREDESSAPSSSPSSSQTHSSHYSAHPDEPQSQFAGPSTLSAPVASSSRSSSSSPLPTVNADAGPSSPRPRLKRRPTSALSFSDVPTLAPAPRPGPVGNVRPPFGSVKGKEREHEQYPLPAHLLSSGPGAKKLRASGPAVQSSERNNESAMTMAGSSVGRSMDVWTPSADNAASEWERALQGPIPRRPAPLARPADSATDEWTRILAGSSPDRDPTPAPATAGEEWDAILSSIVPPPKPVSSPRQPPPFRAGHQVFSPPTSSLPSPPRPVNSESDHSTDLPSVSVRPASLGPFEDPRKKTMVVLVLPPPRTAVASPVRASSRARPVPLPEISHPFSIPQLSPPPVPAPVASPVLTRTPSPADIVARPSPTFTTSKAKAPLSSPKRPSPPLPKVPLPLPVHLTTLPQTPPPPDPTPALDPWATDVIDRPLAPSTPVIPQARSPKPAPSSTPAPASPAPPVREPPPPHLTQLHPPPPPSPPHLTQPRSPPPPSPPLPPTFAPPTGQTRRSEGDRTLWIALDDPVAVPSAESQSETSARPDAAGDALWIVVEPPSMSKPAFLSSAQPPAIPVSTSPFSRPSALRAPLPHSTSQPPRTRPPPPRPEFLRDPSAPSPPPSRRGPAPPRTGSSPFASSPLSRVGPVPARWQPPPVPAPASVLADEVHGAELVDFLIPAPSDLHSVPKYTRTLHLSQAFSIRNQRPTVFGNVEDPDWSPSARGLAYFKFFQPKGPRFFTVGSEERFPETVKRKAELARQALEPKVAPAPEVGRELDEEGTGEEAVEVDWWKAQVQGYGIMEETWRPEWQPEPQSEEDDLTDSKALDELPDQVAPDPSALSSPPPPLRGATAPATPSTTAKLPAADLIRQFTSPSTEIPSTPLSATQAYLLSAQPPARRYSPAFDRKVKAVEDEDALGSVQLETLKQLVALAEDGWDLRTVTGVIALGESRGRRSQNRELVGAFIDKCLQLDAALLVVILASSPAIYGLPPAVLFTPSPQLRYTLFTSIISPSTPSTDTTNTAALPSLSLLTKLEWALPPLQRSLPPHPVISALAIQAYASLPAATTPNRDALLREAEQDARAGWRKTWEIKPSPLSAPAAQRAQEWRLCVGALAERGNKDILPYWRAWLPKTGDVLVQRDTMRAMIPRLTALSETSASASEDLASASKDKDKDMPSVLFLDRLFAMATKEFPADPILLLTHLHLLSLLPQDTPDRGEAIERILVDAEKAQPAWDAAVESEDLSVSTQVRVRRSELAKQARESLDVVEGVFGVRLDLWAGLEEDRGEEIEVWVRPKSVRTPTPKESEEKDKKGSGGTGAARGRIGAWDWGKKIGGREARTSGMVGKSDGLSMRFGRLNVLTTPGGGGLKGGEIRKQTRSVASVGIFG